MDDLLLKMMRLKLAIHQLGYMTKKINMLTFDNYPKDEDHEKIADCGKDDATKGDNWESTGAPLLL